MIENSLCAHTFYLLKSCQMKLQNDVYVIRALHMRCERETSLIEFRLLIWRPNNIFSDRLVVCWHFLDDNTFLFIKTYNLFLYCLHIFTFFLYKNSQTYYGMVCRITTPCAKCFDWASHVYSIFSKYSKRTPTFLNVNEVVIWKILIFSYTFCLF